MIKKASEAYKTIGDINNLVFVGSLIFYLLLILIENIFTGFVSKTFNPHYLLLLIISTGIAAIFVRSDTEEIEEGEIKNTLFDYSLIIFLAIVGFAAVLYASRDLGDIKWVISVFTGLLIVVIGAVLQDEKTSE